MSPELSRRLARVKMFSPIRDLPFAERRTLYTAVHTVTDFDALSVEHRTVILAAEAERDRERHIQHREGVGVTSDP